MYLEKDYYLSEYRRNLKNDREVVSFIKESFPEVEEIEVHGSLSLYVFSFFGYVLYPFSLKILSANLGPFFGKHQIKVRVSRYVSNKLLDIYTFAVKDMDCRGAYYLPLRRHDEMSATLPAFLKSSIKLRRCSGKVPGHDYGVSLSILQYMLLGRPFEVLREVNYAATQRKSRGSLCVDAQIHFWGSDYTIYLEQDMGTESHFELVKKLYLYKRHELTRGRSYVVFSSHLISNYSRCVTFSPKEMGKLYEALLKEDVASLRQYEELYLEDASEEIKDLFVRFAVRVGYYYATRNEGSSERVDAEKITADCVIVRNTRGDDFTIHEMERYLEELADGTNPYRQRMYNIAQMRDTIRKFRGMCEHMCYLIHKGYFDTLEVQTVINDGLGCLVYPSVLLSRSYDYMEYRIRGLVESVVAKYYPEILSADYSPLSPFIEFENGKPHCLLHNCYTTAGGSYLCVEHIGYDMGAFCRFYYLYLYCEMLKVPIHLVGLVESEDEMLFFSRISGFHTCHTFIKNDSFFLSFLNLRDLKRHLCTIHKTEKHGYRVVHLSTPDELDALKKMIR